VSEFGGGEMMSNKLIEKNRNRIKKKVFVKEKIKNIRNNSMSHNLDIKSRPSLLADFIGKSKKNDHGFLLSSLNDKDPNAIKIKIYFFSSSNMIEINISKKHIVYDVMRHIMTLY
jgi:hypothetical protein